MSRKRGIVSFSLILLLAAAPAACSDDDPGQGSLPDTEEVSDVVDSSVTDDGAADPGIEDPAPDPETEVAEVPPEVDEDVDRPDGPGEDTEIDLMPDDPVEDGPDTDLIDQADGDDTDQEDVPDDSTDVNDTTDGDTDDLDDTGDMDDADEYDYTIPDMPAECGGDHGPCPPGQCCTAWGECESPRPVCLRFENVTSTSVDVIMTSTEWIDGFDFQVEDDADTVFTILGADPGEAFEDLTPRPTFDIERRKVIWAELVPRPIEPQTDVVLFTLRFSLTGGVPARHSYCFSTINFSSADADIDVEDVGWPPSTVGWIEAVESHQGCWVW